MRKGLKLVISLSMIWLTLGLFYYGFKDSIYQELSRLQTIEDQFTTTKLIDFDRKEDSEETQTKAKRTLAKVQLSQKLETDRLYKIYKLWKDVSIPEEDYSKTPPTIIFIIPGHTQPYTDYTHFSSQLSKYLSQHQIKAEVYAFDFLEQPSAYSGQMLSLQARFVQMGVLSILNKHEPNTYFSLIGFDTGASVAYLASGLEFPLSQMHSIISIQLGEYRSDLHQKYVTRSKELIVDEGLKKQSFKLREQVLHFEIQVCENQGMEKFSFLDVFQGKFKHTLQMSTMEMQGINQCIKGNALESNKFIKGIVEIIQIVSDSKIFNIKEKIQRIQERVKITLPSQISTAYKEEKNSGQRFELLSDHDGISYYNMIAKEELLLLPKQFLEDKSFTILHSCQVELIFKCKVGNELYALELRKPASKITSGVKILQLSGIDLFRKLPTNIDSVQLVVEKQGQETCWVQIADGNNIPEIVFQDLTHSQTIAISSGRGLKIQYLLPEQIPLTICTQSRLLLISHSSKLNFLSKGCTSLTFSQSNIPLTILSQNSDTLSLTLYLSYSQYISQLFIDLRHLLLNNSVLSIVLLLIWELQSQRESSKPQSLMDFAVSKMTALMLINSIHSIYLYFGQDLILKFAFLEHDDYQESFQTFKLTQFYALLLPVLTYTSTLFLILILYTIKYLIGYPLYWCCATRIEKIKPCRKTRRYLGGFLGIAFFIVFGAGFFMNLYYLFGISYVVLYWSILLLSAKPSQNATHIQQHQHYLTQWHLSDLHLLTILLLTLHWDRFVLETWRFIDFHQTFTLAYDIEPFFNYPLFLYPAALLIGSTQRTLPGVLERVGYAPLWVMIVAGYLVGYDLIYRIRIVMSLGLIASAGCIAMGTCLKMGQNHLESQYESKKAKKLKKKNKQINQQELKDKVDFLLKQQSEKNIIPEDPSSNEDENSDISSDSDGSSNCDEVETSLATQKSSQLQQKQNKKQQENKQGALQRTTEKKLKKK